MRITPGIMRKNDITTKIHEGQKATNHKAVLKPTYSHHLILSVFLLLPEVLLLVANRPICHESSS